jgi:hypothetical protein
MNPFVEYDKIIPLLAPQDIAGNITSSNYMDLKYAQEAAFLVSLGAVTSATITDREVLTVEAATAVDGVEASVDFNYRLSGAVGANTWGSITAATAGLSLDPTADDNKLVWIELDLSTLGASDYRYVRVTLTDTPDMTACLVGVVGFIRPRYKQVTFLSATASASA